MKLNDINPGDLLENLHEGVVVHSASTQVLYANKRALELLRLTESQALGKDSLDPRWRFVDAHNRLMAHQDYPVNRALAEMKPIEGVEVGICDSSSDKVTWVLCSAHPHVDASGLVDRVVVSFIDITSHKTDISFESIVSNSNDAIVITKAEPIDGSGPEIIYVNDAFTDLTGFTSSEVLGKTPRILQGPDTSPEARDRIREALALKKTVHERIKNYSKSGQPYWVDLKIFPMVNPFGQVAYFAAIERDISHQVAKEQRLQNMAVTDPLTGLLNRRGFNDEVRGYFIDTPDAPVSTVALIDIDFFKRINDAFGHECGDMALCGLASKLNGALGSSGMLCRYGGEEFAVFLPGISPDVSFNLLDQLRELVSQATLQVAEDRSLTMTVSVGIGPMAKGCEFEQALKCADDALYDAKKAGRNRTVQGVVRQGSGEG